MKRLHAGVAFAAIVALSSCAVLDDVLGQIPCSMYNGPIDGFRLSINEYEVVLEEGAELSLSVSRSWLNSQLRREELSCHVDWIADPEGFVEIDEDDTLHALTQGSGAVTARVTGSAGAKEDSLRVAVVPTPTEQEPNNGAPGATELVDGQTRIGIRDYAGDVDWFYATVPPGASVQFTLRSSVPLDGFWSATYAGVVFAADGTTYLGPANETYTNTSTEDVLAYLRVIVGSYNDPIPYAVRLDLFP